MEDCGEELDTLLERFPIFNENELNRLLTLYPDYYNLLLSADEILEVNCITKLDRFSHQSSKINFQSIHNDNHFEITNIFKYTLNITTTYDTRGEEYCNKAHLLESCVTLLGHRNDDLILDILFQSVVNIDKDQCADPVELMRLIYRLSCISVQLKQQSDGEVEICSIDSKAPISWIESLLVHGISNSSLISISEWKCWIKCVAPNITKIISTIYHYILLGPDCKPIPDSIYFHIPQTDNKSTILRSRQLCNSISIQLGLMKLGGSVKILYNSNENGLSFSIFQQSLIGFYGPTLILIETIAGEMLGYFTEIPWKTSPEWFTGTGESFLFQLYPSWNVYYPLNKNNGKISKYHQFLYEGSCHNNSDLLGLAVGGITSDTPRLHINKSLERCEASSVELIFESGPLLSEGKNFFDIDTLEVWAIPTSSADSYDDAVKTGQMNLSIKERVRSNCAKVDKALFVDDLTSGLFINSIFDHRQEACGRAEFVGIGSPVDGYCFDEKVQIEKLKRENNNK